MATVTDEHAAEPEFSENSSSSSRETFELNEQYALIMKGGGLKGLACIGALKELQRFYDFDLYVGTSAGAIIAALLGAGFSPDELEAILMPKNFSDFIPERFMTVPNLIFHGGLFRGRELAKWIDELLARKLNSPTRVEFSQLPKTKAVRIYACKRDTDALIFDSIKRPDMSVAYAVRCSIAIPLFFTPERHEGLRVFDGGMRHNYPVKKLLEETPEKKFVGLYLGDPIYQGDEPGLIQDLLAISTEALDREALKKYGQHTAIIDPKPISTLDFTLSPEEKTFLILQGRAAALTFLKDKGHVSQAEADKATEQAILAKEKALPIRRKRKQKTKFKLWATFCAATAVGLGWWYYSSPWSLKNCFAEERQAQQAFAEDKSSPLATNALIKCHNPAGYALQGAQAFYRKDYGEAEKNYALAIEYVPLSERENRWRLWRDSLASVQIETGKYPKAIATFKKLIEEDPSGTDVFLWDLGRAYIYLGSTEPTAYSLAIESLRDVSDQAGKSERGRGSIVRAAAYTGQSQRGDIPPEARASARRSAIAELCKGVTQSRDFWLAVLRKARPYPNASFREEIRLLETFDVEKECPLPSNR